MEPASLDSLRSCQVPVCTDWDKIFPNHTYDEELVAIINKELLQLYPKKADNLKDFIDISPKMTYTWLIMHMEDAHIISH